MRTTERSYLSAIFVEMALAYITVLTLILFY